MAWDQDLKERPFVETPAEPSGDEETVAVESPPPLASALSQAAPTDSPACVVTTETETETSVFEIFSEIPVAAESA